MISWLWRFDGAIVLPSYIQPEQALHRLSNVLDRQWKTVRVVGADELRFNDIIPLAGPNWLALAPFSAGTLKINRDSGVLTYRLSSLPSLLYLGAMAALLGLLSGDVRGTLYAIPFVGVLYVAAMAIGRPRAASFLARSMGA